MKAGDPAPKATGRGYLGACSCCCTLQAGGPAQLDGRTAGPTSAQEPEGQRCGTRSLAEAARTHAQRRKAPSTRLTAVASSHPPPPPSFHPRSEGGAQTRSTRCTPGHHQQLPVPCRSTAGRLWEGGLRTKLRRSPPRVLGHGDARHQGPGCLQQLDGGEGRRRRRRPPETQQHQPGVSQHARLRPARPPRLPPSQGTAGRSRGGRCGLWCMKMNARGWPALPLTLEPMRGSCVGGPTPPCHLPCRSR